MYQVTFGDIAGLPDPVAGTLYVVSALVAQAARRVDVVSLATGHPDAVRLDGQIYSVPGFVVLAEAAQNFRKRERERRYEC